ncbi:auxin efflux carrier component 5-like [Humulus lupulus]|uniref:auxin efflux carrier component 5-like n=1 Tax=Humulus lupulus TaxID=3486 RepID=UPI002B40069A|nr:auxin efflux carrier component 5-like [Humulus lupulus]
MIEWEDVYKVVEAMAPLYVALILGYGSVKWWKIFSPEQGGAINRFACFFTLPLYTFDFTAHVDPFQWNYRFIGADAISKTIIVVVLAFWAKLSSKDDSHAVAWSITSYSLSTLTNSLVVGVPLMKAMYGQIGVDIVVQSSVVQSIIWMTLLFVKLCEIEKYLRLEIDRKIERKADQDSRRKVLLNHGIHGGLTSKKKQN